MSQDEGNDLIKNSPDDTLRPSESSRGDTGEAINQLDLILHRYKYPKQYVNQSLDPFDRQTAEMKVVDEARTALQELIRGEVVKARLDELHNLGKDGGNNVITWAGDGKARLIVDRIKSLSSGQTDEQA